MNKLTVTAQPTVANSKTPHWFVTSDAGKEWHVAGSVSGNLVHVVWVASRYFTEQTKSFKEVKLKQGTPAYEAAAKAALDFHARGMETAVVGAIAELAKPAVAAPSLLAQINQEVTGAPAKLTDYFAAEGGVEVVVDGVTFWAQTTRGGHLTISLKRNACGAESETFQAADRGQGGVAADVKLFAMGGGADRLRAKEAKWAEESARFDNWVEPKIPADCRVTVTNVKGHGTGIEGYRWSCKVWLDGKPAGEANEDGDGGPLRWFPVTPAQGKVMQEYARSIGFDLGQTENAEHMIASLAERARETARYERLLKTNVMFKLANGKVVQYKRTPALMAEFAAFLGRVQAKNPGAVELPTAAAVAEALGV